MKNYCYYRKLNLILRAIKKKTSTERNNDKFHLIISKICFGGQTRKIISSCFVFLLLRRGKLLLGWKRQTRKKSVTKSKRFSAIFPSLRRVQYISGKHHTHNNTFSMKSHFHASKESKSGKRKSLETVTDVSSFFAGLSFGWFDKKFIVRRELVFQFLHVPSFVCTRFVYFIIPWMVFPIHDSLALSPFCGFSEASQRQDWQRISVMHKQFDVAKRREGPKMKSIKRKLCPDGIIPFSRWLILR